MNAAVLYTLGKPPRFEEFPEPIPGDGEVIVHVRAAALKPVDKQTASGSHYASPRELPVLCGKRSGVHKTVVYCGARWVIDLPALSDENEGSNQLTGG